MLHKNNLLAILYISFCLNTSMFGQKSYAIHTVAFYNLENLFDTINDVTKKDELSPMMEIKSNRKFIYQDKLSKLASVLTKIGSEQNFLPPAVIGVAEVENRKVLEDLIATAPLNKYPYDIIHYDSPDQRGIDVALLYNKDIFRPTHSESIDVRLYKDGYKVDTRDILQISGYLTNEKVHLIVNHWPSRRGGAKKSSILRENVARKDLYILEKIRKQEPEAKVIFMGDFNDNPTDKSFKKVLKTEKSKKKVKKGELYNPFENMFRKGYNTLTYRGEMFLFDQLFFTDNFIKNTNKPSTFKFYKAGIYNPSYMTLQKGKYKGSPKRSFSGGSYLGGYSDHYPVYIYLLQEISPN
ncbi:endonuclease/exonuclease/phosphatase family protein [Wenyingzhuangia sp. 2_MG-2023]|uniref:endonuclease/exonuclease/phosphatase family protein n=1 Tax=Wenyingzhuangia sp. 2_MG-2023 TaxID=3062639 RepID=UPI0026E2F451|nr:endonuclease/exonuclease/phosphatase family protein [Wenyingzhuangia sp. 2_MG-2023]MDO6737595.1 endonuclease/exonuclease/phosphatase family protein [Wenyingzhuangia sp. 2_MG-2023]